MLPILRADPPLTVPVGLEAYVCPRCHADLAFTPGDGPSGTLACRAGHTFPVDRGLPRFVDDEGYAASFGLQWSTFRRAQLDSATGVAISRTRVLSGTGWPERMPGERILEAGCGMGRFTEVLLST